MTETQELIEQFDGPEGFDVTAASAALVAEAEEANAPLTAGDTFVLLEAYNEQVTTFLLELVLEIASATGVLDGSPDEALASAQEMLTFKKAALLHRTAFTVKQGE